MSSSSSPPRFIQRVNDSISGVLDKLGSEDGKFWCECDDMHCDQQVLLTLREYAALRARGNERLLSAVHQPVSTGLPTRKERARAVNTITIDVATHESALDLYAKLAEFHPDLEIAENGTCSIFLGFVGETDVVEVMDAIHQHLIGRGEPPLSSVTLALSNADRLTSHHEMAGLDMTSRPN